MSLDGVFSVAVTLVGTADQELLRDDPRLQRCVEIYEAAAGEGLVEFEPATMPIASRSAGKFGLSDTAIPVRYDSALLLWALDSEPINTNS